jgi:hypothetical protein
MNWLLTWMFVAIVLWFLAEGFMRPDRIYQFPFLAGVMTFSFILPQLPAAANDPFLPEGAYAKTIFLGVLCLLALRLGWSSRARPLAMFEIAFSERRLVIVAALFSVIGAWFYEKLSHLPGDVSIGVQMSGMPVVYLFFARLLTYGLAIALLCAARKPSPLLFAIIGFDLIFYFERIVITGKRAEATELALMIVLPLWFFRRWAPPRALVMAALAAGTVGMVSMSDYRQIARANSGPVWDQVAQIDFTENFRALIADGGPETRNAVLRIDATDRNLEFDYGAFHWNRLVFNYVPSQLLGNTFKQMLMLPMPSAGRDYNPATGTTETGMADAFQSFWYFGALKFLLLSWVMARIWASAMRGQAAAQIVYILSIVPAMHAISHQTDWVVSVWVHMLIFLGPALAFCVVRLPMLRRAEGPGRRGRGAGVRHPPLEQPL